MTDETHRRRFVGVLLREFDGQFEGAILEGGVMGPEDHSIPDHDVIVGGSARDSGWGILLQPFEIAHETSPGWRGHCAALS